MLPPNAGDSGSQESDCEEITNDPEEIFEPAAEMEVEEEIYSDWCDDEPEVTLPPRTKRSRQDLPQWKKNDTLDRDFSPFEINLTERVLLLDGSSPYQIWEKIFSCDILNHIVTQTNLYPSRDKNNINFSVSNGAMRKFMGILLLTGYHSLPHEQHYWSTQPDLRVQAVYNVLSRNRYFDIKKHIHFADNQNFTKGDKMSKVSPLYEMINNNLIQFGVFHEILGVDESMVPYFGRHSAKMFIRGKPIRFGYKIWSLCGINGYPYHLKIYQGKERSANATTQQEPLGTRVINTMVGIINTNSEVLGHKLYLDNFFTSYDLMYELGEQSVRATGTIRENRTRGAKKTLISSKALQKKERGTFDFCTDGKVFVAKWHDNSIVTICK